MLHSNDFVYAGYYADKNEHIFHHRRKKIRCSMRGKFKYIDDKYNIVYFFNADSITYSFSAEKKYPKCFLEKELEALRIRKDTYLNIQPFQEFIWKGFDCHKYFYNKICKVDKKNGVYYVYFENKKNFIVTFDIVVKETLVC